MSLNHKTVIAPNHVSLLADAPPAPDAENDNQQAPAANDNAVDGSPVDTTRLIAHADVVKAIRNMLRRRGVVARDLADAIADVQVDALEAARTRQMPADVAEWKALAATIAARRAVDRLRQSEARGKFEASLTDDADAHADPAHTDEARDPVDAARTIAILKDLLDSGQLPEGSAEILQAEADGVPHAEIAAELGVSTAVVDTRLSRIRARFRARLVALGMIVTVLLVLVAVFVPFTPFVPPVQLVQSADDRVGAPAPSHPRPVESAPNEPCPPVGDASPPPSNSSSPSLSGNCPSPDLVR